MPAPSKRLARLAVAAVIAAGTLVTAAPAARGVVPAPSGSVVLDISPTIVPPGAPVQARVAVDEPLAAGQKVALQIGSGAGWNTVATKTLDAGGHAVFAVKGGAVGSYLWRAALFPGPQGEVSVESGNERLDVAWHGPGSPGDHVFAQVFRGRPVRWQPCAPIRYRTNFRLAQRSASADLHEALRRVSQLTGIRFVSVGSTNQPQRSGRFVYPAGTDLIVAWATPRRTRFPSAPGADVEGVTRAEGMVANGRPRWTHAGILINSDADASVQPGFGSGKTRGATLLHELGHVMGLAHVLAPSELMYPSMQPLPATIYGAGDAAGLRVLGRRAGCFA